MEKFLDAFTCKIILHTLNIIIEERLIFRGIISAFSNFEKRNNNNQRPLTILEEV